MSDTDMTYNGWTNRETWALVLHINNDEGLYDMAREALREGDYGFGSESFTLTEAREAYFNSPSTITRRAGEIVRELAESLLTVDGYIEAFGDDHLPVALSRIAEDIGSLYRVNWDEAGKSLLGDDPLDEA